MPQPTKKHLSICLLVGFAVVFIGMSMELLQIPTPSEYVANALTWNYYGSLLSTTVLQVVAGISLVGWIAGLIGFLTFKNWGRLVLAAIYMLTIIVSSMTGLVVMRAETATILSIGNFLFLAPLILSFFPPCSGYFEESAES